MRILDKENVGALVYVPLIWMSTRRESGSTVFHRKQGAPYLFEHKAHAPYNRVKGARLIFDISITTFLDDNPSCHMRLLYEA